MVRVLICDDQTVVREGLAAILSTDDEIEVVQAEGGLLRFEIGPGFPGVGRDDERVRLGQGRGDRARPHASEIAERQGDLDRLGPLGECGQQQEFLAGDACGLRWQLRSERKSAGG